MIGITAPGLRYDDYRGIDVHGKILAVIEHEPQENDPHSPFNGTGNTRYATNRVKALIARAHGAVAVVMAEPNRKHPSNLERVNRIGGKRRGFHPDYHHTTDTPDKIDYPKMLKILQLSYLSAWDFADQSGYPRFVADPPGG